MSAEQIQRLVMDAVRAAGDNSARTAQANDYRIGASDVGVCREYLRRTIAQGERHPEGGIKWKAFIGQALGDWLETALSGNDTTGLIHTQEEVTCTLPSGLSIPGHIDAYQEQVVDDVQVWNGDTIERVVEPGWVLDFKSKDGILLADREEIDRGHLYQIALYWLALVTLGKITPEAPAFLVYVDRSGRTEEPVVKQVTVDDALIAEIDEWIDDAIYAHVNHVEASRDRPYEWCQVACPFFLDCRGAEVEHRVQGLIEDPDLLLAIEVYTESLAAAKLANARKEQAAEALEGIQGSTGTHVVSWTHVQGSDMAYYRRPYSRLNIRPVPTKRSTT